MGRTSRSNAWMPDQKFTAGLNVSQEEWDRIFGKKSNGTSQEGATPTARKLVVRNHNADDKVDGVTVKGEPAVRVTRRKGKAIYHYTDLTPNDDCVIHPP